MRTALNCLIAFCFASLAAINFATNPFTPALQAQEVACQGAPPGENCGCCEECGCWVCE
jgi:hypothetical protein